MGYVWAFDGCVKAGLAVSLAFALARSGRAVPTPQRALAEQVAAIQHADYAGERQALQALADALEVRGSDELQPYRDYWRGFALWRRALNGFNDGAPPDELRADLEAAVAAFQRAERALPGWIEPGIARAGCLGSLGYLAKDEAARRERIVAELKALRPLLEQQGEHNPRALWVLGGSHLWAPPPLGGDPRKAAATHRRGLEAARAEAVVAPGDQPTWIPAWGAPESLMNLAFIHTHTAIADRELALAYAEGALAAVPHWHYLRDLLLPQARALPEQVRP